MPHPSLFHVLLVERRWDQWSVFCLQFERAARHLARELSRPKLASVTVSRKSFHRWAKGDWYGRPWPDTALILEHLFNAPAAQLFSPAPERAAEGTSASEGRASRTSVLVADQWPTSRFFIGPGEAIGSWELVEPASPGWHNGGCCLPHRGRWCGIRCPLRRGGPGRVGRVPAPSPPWVSARHGRPGFPEAVRRRRRDCAPCQSDIIGRSCFSPAEGSVTGRPHVRLALVSRPVGRRAPGRRFRSGARAETTEHLSRSSTVSSESQDRSRPHEGRCPVARVHLLRSSHPAAA